MVLMLSKVLSQLLLPPGGLILLGLFGFMFSKRWWGRGVLFLSLSALWLLSTEPVRDMLTQPLEFKHSVLSVEHLESSESAIVLLGGGIYENAPEYGGRDQLRSSAMMRTLYAAEVAKKTGLDVYATGGRPLTEGADPEGSIMRRWLIRFGLPESSVFAENVADNTWENAVYMKTLLAKRGVHRVVLVTSAWHMPRSVWCFKAHGLDVVAAPVDFLTGQSHYDLRSYLPHWTVLADSGLALHEYLGLLWYKLRYAE